VQFETPEEVEKALQRNGNKLGNEFIEVERPVGILTCIHLFIYSKSLFVLNVFIAADSGQRFALNSRTRNIATRQLAGITRLGREFSENVPVGSSSSESVTHPKEAKTGELNPVAPEFHPSTPPYASQTNYSTAAPHSLSSLLNTEHDTVVAPEKKKSSNAFSTGRAVGPSNKAADSMFPSLKQLATEHLPMKAAQVPAKSTQAAAATQPPLKSFFPTAPKDSNSNDAVFAHSLFGTDLPIDTNNNPYAFFGSSSAVPHDKLAQYSAEESSAEDAEMMVCTLILTVLFVD
jgi:hypothetical protein